MGELTVQTVLLLSLIITVTGVVILGTLLWGFDWSEDDSATVTDESPATQRTPGA
jgi:hypothetical protein